MFKLSKLLVLVEQVKVTVMPDAAESSRSGVEAVTRSVDFGCENQQKNALFDETTYNKGGAAPSILSIQARDDNTMSFEQFVLEV